MKYYIRYDNIFKYYEDEDVESIIIDWHDNSSVKQLVDFCNLYSTKKIYVDFLYEEEKIINDYITAIQEAAIDNIGIIISSVDYPTIELGNLDYMFSDCPLCWEELNEWLDLPKIPDAILINAEFGFSLPEVSKICHSKGVKVKCIPNLAQCSTKWTPPIKRFFIRPEDMPLYEGYVDVLEFHKPNDRINTLYEIYNIKKRWLGELSDLISNLDDLKINSRKIISEFAEVRVGCDRRCLKGKACSICENTIHIAEMLEESGIKIEPLSLMSEWDADDQVQETKMDLENFESETMEEE